MTVWIVAAPWASMTVVLRLSSHGLDASPGLHSQVVVSGAGEAVAVEPAADEAGVVEPETVEPETVEPEDGAVERDAAVADGAGDCADEPHPANVRTTASANRPIRPRIG